MREQVRQLTIRMIGCGAMIFTIAGSLAGCDDANHDSGLPPVVMEPEQPSLWRTQNQSSVVAVPEESRDQQLAAAIAKARATAEDARIRWSVAKPDDRPRWAIKWAAPISLQAMSKVGEDRVEHVWVEPVNWSPFRIEGVLASEPTVELACGKSFGELVSFPTDELSDWIHLAGDDFNGAREGGFTVELLRDRFGTPRDGGEKPNRPKPQP